MTDYFIYADDFDVKPISYQFIHKDKYPSDIKRIISKGTHNYHKRIYFFSPSKREVYKPGSEPLRYQETGNSHVYCLIDDMNKRCKLYVNDKLIEKTKNMNKIIL